MGQVILSQIMDLLTGPDMIQIVDMENGADLFKGYKGVLLQVDPDFIATNGVKTVKKYRAHLEIIHREWKKNGFIAPMMPEALPQYLFKDFQVDLIHQIYI